MYFLGGVYMKTKKIPTAKEVKSFMDYAMVKKLEVSKESVEELTSSVIGLHNMSLITKDAMDNYLYLTKASARANAQKK
jgi:hypothetical protein